MNKEPGDSSYKAGVDFSSQVGVDLITVFLSRAGRYASTNGSNASPSAPTSISRHRHAYKRKRRL